VSAWPIQTFLSTLMELRPDQREIVTALFYHRFVARLTDAKEPMYRALRGMDQSLRILRKGRFTEEQWPVVQDLLSTINGERKEHRLTIHKEVSKEKNQRNADVRAKITSAALRDAWATLEGTPREKAGQLAVKYGDDPENILRRIRDWHRKDKLNNS
jgi:hypothetical protein